MKQFSEVLKSLRQSAGLSIPQLAKALNVSQVCIRDSWEAGKCEPSTPNLRQIAYFFGVDVDELLDMEGFIADRDAEWEKSRDADQHL